MRARGFTLIEVMVVLVILAITATAVTFSIEGMQARDTEREIDRLRLVLEAAGERAAVHGTPIAAEFLPGRYRFSELDAEGNGARSSTWIRLPSAHCPTRSPGPDSPSRAARRMPNPR